MIDIISTSQLTLLLNLRPFPVFPDHSLRIISLSCLLSIFFQSFPLSFDRSMITLFWVILASLSATHAAPHRPGGEHSEYNPSLADYGAKKRQYNLPQIVFTATQLQVISETETETYTETITTTQGTFPASAPSGSASVTVQPEVHLMGEIPSIVPSVQSILFLPLGGTTPSDSGTTFLASSTDSAQLPVTTSFGLNSSPSATVTSSEYDDNDNASDNNASSSSTAVGPAMALDTPIVTGPLLSAYYPDWVASDLAPEKIDMTRFDWIDYAFAIPDKNFNLVWDDPDSSPDILNRLVSAAHSKGTKVKLSIGGWDGSQ